MAETTRNRRVGMMREQAEKIAKHKAKLEEMRAKANEAKHQLTEAQAILNRLALADDSQTDLFDAIENGEYAEEE